MRKINQKGFGAVEALLILAIVGIIGGAGWYVFNSQQKTDKASTDTTQTTTKKDASKTTDTKKDETKYLEIKEWGVKVPLNTLSIYYTIADNRIDFRTKQLDAICDVKTPTSISVYRGKADDMYNAFETGGEESFKTVYDGMVMKDAKSYSHYIKPFIMGDYYYLPPSFGYETCTTNVSKTEAESKGIDQLREAVQAMKQL